MADAPLYGSAPSAPRPNPSRLRLFQMHASRVKDAYVAAKAKGIDDPVVFLRVDNLIIDDPKIREIIENAEEAGKRTMAVAINAEPYRQAYRTLCKVSFRAALAMGQEPDASSPFVVVLITPEGASVEKMPEPA